MDAQGRSRQTHQEEPTLKMETNEYFRAINVSSHKYLKMQIEEMYVDVEDERVARQASRKTGYTHWGTLVHVHSPLYHAHNQGLKAIRP